MPKAHHASILAATSLFGGLQPAHRMRLAEKTFFRELGRDEILFHEGQSGEVLYLLVSGQVQAHKTGPDGNQSVIKLFKPGEMFAQVILFERSDYPVTAVALTCSTVLGLYRRDILAELNHEGFRNDFIAQLMQRQRYLASRLAALATPDVEERLRCFLRDHYGPCTSVICTLRRKDLAAAIGITPETLSRLLGRLKKRDTLVWRADRIVISPAFWQTRHREQTE